MNKPIAMRKCACESACGLSFPVDYRNRGRRYHPVCKAALARQRELRAGYKKVELAKRKANRKPRTCRCGCKRPLAMPSLQYATDCPVRRKQLEDYAQREHTGARRHPAFRARGKSRSCASCEGLAHRRQSPACKRCGEPFRELPALDPRDPRFMRQPWGGP